MLITESPRAKIWCTTVNLCLAQGMNHDKAVDAADSALLAYEARFGKPNDSLVGATVGLDTALVYLERHVLIGRKVTLKNCIDPPPIGKLKNLIDKDFCGEIVWESGAGFGMPTIYPTDRIQLVCSIDQLLAQT